LLQSQISIKGSKGYFRAQMRHSISEVHNGERMHLELFSMIP
jgi:hypothetical protein